VGIEEPDEVGTEGLDVGVERQLHTTEIIKYLTFTVRCAKTEGCSTERRF
jgi:hypothetical protein